MSQLNWAVFGNHLITVGHLIKLVPTRGFPDKLSKTSGYELDQTVLI